jgi:hypothetical protein
MTMPLSAKSIAVLQDWKRRHAPTSLPVSLSMQELAEVYEARRQDDARSHALWAAERLVKVLQRGEGDAYRELVIADIWAFGILKRRYLVRQDWLKIAYEHALKLAGKSSRAVN